MPANFPGPFELRMFYTTTISSIPLTHVAKYNCDVDGAVPGALFSAMNIKTRDGSNPTLAAFCTTWTNLVKAAYSSGAGNAIDYYELWQVAPLSFDASFISALAQAISGTNGGTTKNASQVILTFRTTEGGIMKLNFMESVQDFGIKDTPPYSNAQYEAIATHILGGGNAFLGRDTSAPFASIAMFPGQNEALFKQRFR